MSLQVITSTFQSRSHLRSSIAYGSITGVAPTFEIPPLPAMVSLKKIYADLLGYLFDHGAPALTVPSLMLNLSQSARVFQE